MIRQSSFQVHQKYSFKHKITLIYRTIPFYGDQFCTRKKVGFVLHLHFVKKKNQSQSSYAFVCVLEDHTKAPWVAPMAFF